MQAEVLGVALNTMERWITKSVQIAHIERLATGLYRKYPHVLHSEGNEGVREIVSFPKISRQFFDYIPTLVDIYSRYVDIFLS